MCLFLSFVSSFVGTNVLLLGGAYATSTASPIGDTEVGPPMLDAKSSMAALELWWLR